MENHEKTCRNNPAARTCMTCRYAEVEPAEPDVGALRTRTCALELLPDFYKEPASILADTDRWDLQDVGTVCWTPSRDMAMMRNCRKWEAMRAVDRPRGGGRCLEAADLERCVEEQGRCAAYLSGARDPAVVGLHGNHDNEGAKRGAEDWIMEEVLIRSEDGDFLKTKRKAVINSGPAVEASN